MTQEEKQLLLKDLCARLPYGVIVRYKNAENEQGDIKLGYGNIGYCSILGVGWWKDCKPYLRPMSSMPEEEKKEARNLIYATIEFTDWCNEHHFDYRHLIEKGLALEAPEDMYKL